MSKIIYENFTKIWEYKNLDVILVL
jgi:hypothetical protein